MRYGFVCPGCGAKPTGSRGYPTQAQHNAAAKRRGLRFCPTHPPANAHPRGRRARENPLGETEMLTAGGLGALGVTCLIVGATRKQTGWASLDSIGWYVTGILALTTGAGVAIGAAFNRAALGGMIGLGAPVAYGLGATLLRQKNEGDSAPATSTAGAVEGSKAIVKS